MIKVTYISGCPLWERNQRVWSGGDGGGGGDEEEQDSYGISITICQEYKHMYMTQVGFNYYNNSWEEGGGKGYYDLHVMTPIE